MTYLGYGKTVAPSLGRGVADPSDRRPVPPLGEYEEWCVARAGGHARRASDHVTLRRAVIIMRTQGANRSEAARLVGRGPSLAKTLSELPENLR